MEEKLKNITNEALVLGSLFKKPVLYIEYENMLNEKYDFVDESCLFMFKSFVVYYKTFSQEVSETKLNSFMLQDKEGFDKYKSLGGYKFVSKIMDLAKDEDFENYITTLKKYSLLRELHHRGFNVAKIIEHKKFSTLSSDEIIQIINYQIDFVASHVLRLNSIVKLGENAREKILKYKEVPDVGLPFPYDVWTNSFRGLRSGKCLFLGLKSNNGKSRQITYISSHFAYTKGLKTLFIANEAQEEDEQPATIVSVANNPEHGFNLGIDEKTLVTGEYTKEQEKGLMQVADYMEEKKDNMLYLWTTNYSAEQIKTEIRRYVMTQGVGLIVFDTLKTDGDNIGDWSRFLQLATAMSETVKELSKKGYFVSLMATFQLHDSVENMRIEEIDSNSISFGRYIRQVADFVVYQNPILLKDYNKYYYSHPEWGEMPLDSNKRYFGTKIDKSRSGGKCLHCVEYNLDLNTYIDLGRLIIK